MKQNKEKMFNQLEEVINNYDEKVEDLKLSKNDNVMIVVVDMINDFVYTSLMKNKLAEEIIPKISSVLDKFRSNGKLVMHINEAHPENAVEFNYFPKHGIKGTEGAKIVQPLYDSSYDTVFYKNSTNGIHINEVKEYIEKQSDIEKVIVTGVCTDICVMQFAVGLKTYFNQLNKELEVIIPTELTETYDGEGHSRDLFYYMSLNLASQAGVKIVKNVTLS